MKMKKLFLLINFSCLVILSSSCVAPQPQPIQRMATFIESEYAPYDIPSNSTITGQAFLKTRAGDVKFGAGNIVYMNPVTSYSTEWYEALIHGQALTAHDPRIEKYNRRTIADGNGSFRFSNLPAGEYYLACEITWEVQSEYGPVLTGGIAHARVKVASGEEVKAILTY